MCAVSAGASFELGSELSWLRCPELVLIRVSVAVEVCGCNRAVRQPEESMAS